MHDHPHHHSHSGAHEAAHPTSALLMSMPVRGGVAAVLIAALWGLILWAMS